MKKRGPKGPSKYTKEFLDNEAKLLKKFFEDENNVFLKEFSISRGYHSQRIHEFAESNEKFSLALLLCKDIQEMRMLKHGLKGKWNAYMVDKALKNCSGWRDKHETEHSGSVQLKIDGK